MCDAELVKMFVKASIDLAAFFVGVGVFWVAVFFVMRKLLKDESK